MKSVTPASKTKPKRRHFGRGSLLFITALFAASAAIRFGEGVSQAFATATEATTILAEDKGQECVTEGGLMELLENLRSREKRVAEREAILADRAQAMQLAEGRMEARLAALIEAENKLAATVAIADTGAEEDVSRLVTLYENMKAKDAAPLFAAMPPEFAAGFLARMRSDASAAIMANLEPQIAYSISVVMAGRNAGAPEN